MSTILKYAAFTTDPAGGNPAGVVLDADSLSDTEMQHIAADIGYSETAFVTHPGPRRTERHHRLRFFSPLAEVDFCGHATIATSVALARRHGPARFQLSTNAGEITVDTHVASDGAVLAGFTSVPTRSRPATTEEVEETLRHLGWRSADLDERPAHVAYAGNDHLVLPIRTRARLSQLHYDFDGLTSHMQNQGWTTVNLVYFESSTVVHARNPFPVGGVVEDPATGAAAAALGAYLVETGAVVGTQQLRVVQGVDMGRPSVLELTVTEGDRRVHVAGSAVPL